jgi:hypothetical protein
MTGCVKNGGHGTGEIGTPASWMKGEELQWGI